MKTLTHTIIVIIAFSLLAAGVVPARNASDEEVQAAVELQIKQTELEQQSRAEVAAVLAQAQTSPPAVPVTPSVLSPSPVPPIPSPPPTEPASVELVANDVSNLVQSFSLGSRSGSTGTVLVIPSEQTRTENLLTINEDMSVMSRIFEKNIEQARISIARGNIYASRQDPFSMFLGGGRGGIQSIYLQGFGALFMMKVDFPLTPPPDMQDDEKETTKAEEGDPVWQQMRREMYEPEKVYRRRRTDRPEEIYDAEKVENLKTTLIKALKHAANIRSLKPDESVILTVTGSSQATSTTIEAARVLPGENQIIISEQVGDGKTRTRIVQGTSLDNIGLSSPSILVIRTKKSGIDAFAKGDLGFDQFRQRVQLLTYPHLGGAAKRGGPLDFYYNDIVRPRSTSSSNRR